MPNANYEMLKEAIARNSGAVLSLPSAGMIRHHKTRFLAEEENGFWIESAPEERPLLESLISEVAPVGVAFKAGHSSVIFASPIRVRQEQYKVNQGMTVEALFLPFPDSFRQKQRRAVYRVQLMPAHAVTLRLWRIPEHAILRDRPMASQEIHTQLQNISVQGLGAMCEPARDGKPAKMLVQERMRVLLAWAGEELITEGRVIHTRIGTANRTIMGLQFKKLEKDLEGRQSLSKLTELIGVLQRDEIKRRRAVEA